MSEVDDDPLAPGRGCLAGLLIMLALIAVVLLVVVGVGPAR